MRTITIPAQTVSEAIESYDHFVGFKVNIVVAKQLIELLQI